METKIYVCGDLVQILVQIYGYIIKTSDIHTCANVFERNEFARSEISACFIRNLNLIIFTL